MRHAIPVPASLLVLAGVALICGGCGARVDVPDPPSESETNLMKIGRAYLLAGGGLKHPPHNARDLIPYLQQMGESESVLRSPRDQQEYVILWDVKSADLIAKPPQPGLAPEQRFPVLAYEKIGVGGSRFVLQVPNRVVSMSDDELKQAYFPPGHRPPP